LKAELIYGILYREETEGEESETTLPEFEEREISRTNSFLSAPTNTAAHAQQISAPSFTQSQDAQLISPLEQTQTQQQLSPSSPIWLHANTHYNCKLKERMLRKLMSM